MNRRTFTRILLASPLALHSWARSEVVSSSTSKSTELETLRQKHRLPALASIVTLNGKTCELSAVGMRKEGASIPVTTEDRFHIGSCTKSMTATLVAMFVEEGKLTWDTTLAQALPRLGNLHPGYAGVTMDQLLRHKGGLPGDAPAAAWSQAWKKIGTPMTQRAVFVSTLLEAPPAYAPGSRFVYSNQGYAVAGHILETLADHPWEELIQQRLFSPLGMKSAGFGVPDKLGQIVEPWGHVIKGGNCVPVQQDNPPAIGPAGTVHCSLGDLAVYARLHLDRGKKQRLLSPASFKHLHSPLPGDEYACGWCSVPRDWAGGRALNHSGSNTMWYVVMWLAPERNFAAIAATNVAGDDASRACDQVVANAIKRWL